MTVMPVTGGTINMMEYLLQGESVDGKHEVEIYAVEAGGVVNKSGNNTDASIHNKGPRKQLHHMSQYESHAVTFAAT